MGSPVVLCHGIATSSEKTWRESGWLDLLADAGREVIPIDMPGHGVNKDTPAPDDVMAWMLSQLPDEPVDAIGFSMGASLLLSLMSQNPGRYNKLVVAGVGTNLFERDLERGRRIAAAIAGNADPSDPQASYFGTLASEPDINPDGVAALMKVLPEFDTAALSNLTNPVLVVLGDQDFTAPADPLIEALPNSELVTLKGVDHFATPKNFGFLDAGLEFLGAVPF